jgi:hypothetical protein
MLQVFSGKHHHWAGQTNPPVGRINLTDFGSCGLLGNRSERQCGDETDAPQKVTCQLGQARFHRVERQLIRRGLRLIRKPLLLTRHLVQRARSEHKSEGKLNLTLGEFPRVVDGAKAGAVVHV